MKLHLSDGHTRARIDVHGSHVHVRIADLRGHVGAILVDSADVDYVVGTIERLLLFLSDRTREQGDAASPAQ